MKTLEHYKKSSLLCAALGLGILGAHKVHAQPAVETWTQHYDGSALVVLSSGDMEKLMVDSSDNVIVAGFSDFENFSYSGLVIKYSGAGVPLWTNRYSPTGNAYHRAIALATDGSGNIFVTGDVQGANGPVFATFKYSGAGVPLWTNLGPSGSASAVAVDGSGNVFVAGYSDGCATIKYSSAGVPLWTNRYSDVDATALAVDGSGNVFVAGGLQGTNETSFATFKYSGAGVPLWTNLGPRGSATAVAADGSGNVFVTGYWYVTNGYGDYATIKYSGAGVPLWTNRYNGPNSGDDRPTALAVDGSGNVVVTGNSPGECATIKYSGAGVPLWTNLFPGGSAAALAVDGSGNVLVTGYPATIKYSGAGIPLWTNYGGARAVAVDGSDSVFVTDASATTIAYSGGGVALWTNRYIESAIGGDDHARSVAVDGNGNVLVTGDSYASDGTYGYATIKYSGAGVALWTNRGAGGSGGPTLSATAVAADSNGNVVVTGASHGTNGLDYATIKYSDAGVALWTNRYNGPGNDDDFATALAVDGSGDIFVTGYSHGFSGDVDYATIKYSGAGVPLWTNRYNGTAYDAATALAVDGSGNVFVTGFSYSYNNHLGTYYDYATIKYSSAGVPLWTNHYNGSGNYNDYATALAVDSSGNVVVTGDSYGSGSDYATIKYSGAGVPLWTNRYNGPRNGDDIPTAVAVDSSGNVFVTGYSAITDVYPYTGYATIKYSGAGGPLWTNRYNGPNRGDDRPTALAVDGSGNVVVAGNSPGECATINYSGAGVPLWTNLFPGGSAAALAVDGSGNVFLTGTSIASDGSSDYLTIKYSGASLSPIPLNYQVVGNQLVLSWTNAAFSLQSAAAVQGDYTNVPAATSPHTNLLSGVQRYFRLRGN